MKNNLTIRLQKKGRVKRPFFLIVVSLKNKSAKGAYLDKLGFYDPFSNKQKNKAADIVIEKTKLNLWLQRGALPTAAAYKLIFG